MIKPHGSRNVSHEKAHGISDFVSVWLETFEGHQVF